MDRKCDVCGTTYTAKRNTSRYCSTKCRTRASRGGGGNVVEIPAPPPLASIADRAGPIERAASKELELAGRLDSTVGQAALALARRLDAPGLDTGSAVAAVARQLEATMATATRGAGATTAPQKLRDELAERRARHA